MSSAAPLAQYRYLQQQRNGEAKKQQEHVNRLKKKLGKQLLASAVQSSDKVCTHVCVCVSVLCVSMLNITMPRTPIDV